LGHFEGKETKTMNNRRPLPSEVIADYEAADSEERRAAVISMALIQAELYGRLEEVSSMPSLLNSAKKRADHGL
jgi:hypothetical protein